MAQSKMTDSRFAEDDTPLLKKWGKLVTSRIFSVNSFVNANLKKSLLQVMEAIRHSVNPQVCVQKESVPELLCYLPYLIRFACETGYLHHIQVNINKPILMVFNTTADASYLMETISAPTAPKSKLLLQSKQILTNSEIANGANYRSYLITTSDSISCVDFDINNYDVIICTTDCLPHLPQRDFSIVIGQDTLDPALNGFQIFCSVVLLQCCSNVSTHSPILTQSTGHRLCHYSDMIASGDCAMPVISETQICGVEEMMNRVTDFKCSHIPIELNICGDDGLEELVYALPSLLGSAANNNSSCLDLSKPVLFLTTDVAAYQLVSGVLPVSVPIECNEITTPDPKEMYQCCLLENEFEICTFCQQINSSEIVLTSTEFTKDKSGKHIEPNDFYKNLKSYNVSAVVIVQTKYLPDKKEQEIVYHFRGVTTILIRANAGTEKDKKEGNIRVVPKLLTVQKISAELIYPTLMTHGNDITERFLLSQTSVLTHCQQVGLANIVEWLGSSSNSSRQVAHVTTAIGFKYAAMMLWCLPTMLEWADNNQLIPNGAIHLRKPLLILCTNKESLDEIWNMVYSKSAFHQTSLLRSVYTCSDGKSFSYVVADAKSAANIGTTAGQYKLIFADTACLNQLPDDAFADIIVFMKGIVPSNEVNAVTLKFAQKSKIIFFTASPVGLLKKIDLQNTFENNVNGTDDNMDANVSSTPEITMEKSETIDEAPLSHKIQIEKPIQSDQILQVEELGEEHVDVGITLMPPDAMTNVEIEKDNTDHVGIDQPATFAELTSPAEIHVATPQNVSSLVKEYSTNYVDEIGAVDHSSVGDEEPDIDSPSMKETFSKWSRCKEVLHKISSRKGKTRKQRSCSPNVSNKVPQEIEEDVDIECHNMGLFICWRRTKSHNKVCPKKSRVHMVEKSGNSDGSTGATTWTGPVIYLTSTKPADACPVDMPEEVQQVDASSLLPACLSDPSSVDTISLTERDNSGNNNIFNAAKPLDVEEVDKILSNNSSPCENIAFHCNTIEHVEVINNNNFGKYTKYSKVDISN